MRRWTAEDAERIAIDFTSTELSLAEQMFGSPNLYLSAVTPISPEATAQFVGAIKQIKLGQVSEAKSSLHLLTKQFPTLSGPWLKLGDMALKAGNEAEAITHFEQAIVVNANNYVARNRMASLLRERGDFGGAKYQYEMALQSWPGLVSAHLNLGILFDLYLGEKEQALAHYKLAQKLNELDNKPLNKQLKIWIIDLGRQIKRSAKQEARANG